MEGRSRWGALYVRSGSATFHGLLVVEGVNILLYLNSFYFHLSDGAKGDLLSYVIRTTKKKRFYAQVEKT